jgi:F0F1-type ATP synthase membrane subunit c/vacuolar-type H+-ATPase subunit K
LSPGAYARLVRTARAALPAGAELVLGEVAGYDGPRPDRLGAAEFAAALPRGVACAGAVWAQHTYVGRGRGALAADRDAAGNPALTDGVIAALARHRCPREHRVWITETGAAASRRACPRMRSALRAWARDPRVDAAFQYSFRDDPVFPVGLADAALTELRPAYRAWAGDPC